MSLGGVTSPSLSVTLGSDSTKCSRNARDELSQAVAGYRIVGNGVYNNAALSCDGQVCRWLPRGQEGVRTRPRRLFIPHHQAEGWFACIIFRYGGLTYRSWFARWWAFFDGVIYSHG
jgi:hypothetical protein